jgi:hypothetical protein
LIASRPSPREGREHLEIDQGPGADAAELLHVLHTRDAQHDHREDDRREHHLDQLDEHVAERLDVDPEAWIEESEGDTGEDADEDLDVELSEKSTHGLSPGGCRA